MNPYSGKFRFALLSALFLGAFNSAHATNGTYLIGTTPASQAMGGTGVAHYTSDGNALFKNPALLAAEGEDAKCSLELSTTHMHIKNHSQFNSAQEVSSQSNIPMAPNVTGSYHPGKDLGLGWGIFSLGGSQADFAGNSTLSEVKSDLTLSRFVVGGAYAVTPWLSVGAGPFLTLGRFSLNSTDSTTGKQSTRAPDSSTGFGYEAGIGIHPNKQWEIGASFISKSKVTYNNVSDFEAFAPVGASVPRGDGVVDPFDIEQPMEIAAGIKFNPCDATTITFDYRRIMWSEAAGSRDLGWSDQDVFAVGGEYRVNSWSWRLGFNYAASPVGDQSNIDGAQGDMAQGKNISRRVKTLFNTVAFPAFSSTHFTAGGAYQFTKHLGIDLAFVYSPYVTAVGEGKNQSGLLAGSAFRYTTGISQSSFALGAKYLF